MTNPAENEVIENAEVEEVVEDVTDEVAESEVVEDDRPKGFLTLEEYIEKGGDPDMYRGKKAFEQYYNKSQETKQSNAALAEMQNNIKAMTQAMESSKQEALAKQKKELEAKLHKAREDFDISTVEKVNKELWEMEQKKPEPVRQGEPPVVQNFRASNPALDHSSPEFDPDLNDLVEKRVNQQFQKVNPAAMTEADINELLSRAYDSVKSKFAKYQAPKAKTPPKTRPATQPKVKAENTALGDLSASARGIYDMILETSGETAAKNYVKNLSKGK